MSRLPVAAAIGATVAVLAWGEAVHLRASRRMVGAGIAGPLAVVVLGYRDRGRSRANAMNRWRVRIALRTIGGDPDALLVCSGGAAAGATPEAVLLARHAVELGHRGTVLVEDRSRSTRENIANVAPLLEGAGRIAIASQPLHALKARLYLRRIRPDLARRLVRADDERIGEGIAVKPLLAVHGLVSLRRARRAIARLG